jgi:hypothetical protein
LSLITVLRFDSAMSLFDQSSEARLYLHITGAFFEALTMSFDGRPVSDQEYPPGKCSVFLNIAAPTCQRIAVL